MNNPKVIIDLIFTNNSSLINNIEVKDNISKSCDHLSIICELNLSKQVSLIQQKSIRKYNNDNLILLNDMLQNFNWFELTNGIYDINIIYNLIVMKYNELIDKCVPLETKIYQNQKPFNFEIRKLIRIRRKLNRQRNFINSFNHEYYYLTDLIGEKIRDYDNLKINGLVKNNNFYSFYKYIKKQTKDPIAKSFLDNNGNRITDEIEIVENFKLLFESKYKFDRNEDLYKFDTKVDEILDKIDLTMNKLIEALKRFKFNKTQGQTFIDNVVIQKCINGSLKLLFCLYYRIIEFRRIPDKMKISIVTPILKPGRKRNSFDSHRCVSVQPNIYRIFECLISIDLTPFLYLYFIPDCQYGYRPSTRLHEIHNDIQKIIFDTYNNRNYIGIDVIFLDMSDAFDSVSHFYLIEKLRKYGIRGELLDILIDSLNNRKQFIKFENTLSTEMSVISGCPQGGVLSPTFYNVYTADMINHINCHLFNFADDTIILKPIFNLNDCHLLQNDIDNLYEYLSLNNLVVNSNKCKFMRITNKSTSPFIYNINGIELKQVNEQKYIGIVYDSKMSFNKHIDYIVEKTLKKFNILRYLSKNLNSYTMINLYKTYLLPILEYSNMCLTLTKTQSAKIEKVQRKITRFICSKSSQFNLCYEERLVFLDLSKLETRRLIQLYKYIYKLKVCYPDIPQKVLNQINFVIINNECFAKIKKNRILLSDKYIIDYCCKLFNELPSVIRNEQKKNVFNYLVKCLFKL